MKSNDKIMFNVCSLCRDKHGIKEQNRGIEK